MITIDFTPNKAIKHLTKHVARHFSLWSQNQPCTSHILHATFIWSETLPVITAHSLCSVIGSSGVMNFLQRQFHHEIPRGDHEVPHGETMSFLMVTMSYLMVRPWVFSWWPWGTSWWGHEFSHGHHEISHGLTMRPRGLLVVGGGGCPSFPWDHKQSHCHHVWVFQNRTVFQCLVYFVWEQPAFYCNFKTHNRWQHKS